MARGLGIRARPRAGRSRRWRRGASPRRGRPWCAG